MVVPYGLWDSVRDGFDDTARAARYGWNAVGKFLQGQQQFTDATNREVDIYIRQSESLPQSLLWQTAGLVYAPVTKVTNKFYQLVYGVGDVVATVFSDPATIMRIPGAILGSVDHTATNLENGAVEYFSGNPTHGLSLMTDGLFDVVCFYKMLVGGAAGMGRVIKVGEIEIKAGAEGLRNMGNLDGGLVVVGRGVGALPTSVAAVAMEPLRVDGVPVLSGISLMSSANPAGGAQPSSLPAVLEQEVKATIANKTELERLLNCNGDVLVLNLPHFMKALTGELTVRFVYENTFMDTTTLKYTLMRGNQKVGELQILVARGNRRAYISLSPKETVVHVVNGGASPARLTELRGLLGKSLVERPVTVEFQVPDAVSAQSLVEGFLGKKLEMRFPGGETAVRPVELPSNVAVIKTELPNLLECQVTGLEPTAINFALYDANGAFIGRLRDIRGLPMRQNGFDGYGLFSR